MAKISTYLSPSEWDERFPRVAFYAGRDLSVMGYCAFVAWGRVEYATALEGEFVYKHQIKITYRPDCWRQLINFIRFFATNLIRVRID